MKRLLYYVVTIWLVLWFQVLSNHFLGGTLFSVQWVLMIILHTGLVRGPWNGEALGFIWGLFIDASSLGLLGVHAILYALAGYASGMFRRQLDSSKIWTQAIFTWIVSTIYFLLYLVMERFLSTTEGTFQWTLITIPIVNALLAPFVFRVLDHWTMIWDMAPVEH